ncbi:MAG: septum site-determining protein MinC [Hydrogenophaga sp.]|uniref:septum site-determining protein MinC n=1 Tax=Hydrogenophaga sp. TaxID=1904254 RepID=UPI0016BD3791|nr:septum site-determining protein MinC [Hydrogenophaga sp.]NIM40319.1 septum site-determining protein MinC [Hydrogenophaga sp.]NIN25550.1 septum site-determining protein MinC [Hydrogenophaga sp.]NIN30202.1 septum site-determining protein MinC [Hydrogenophaga sp.]NIN54503.1 septum site-determining protein MinC [Hydrogenophaga sp.]NIO50376.1 septum site-determining protein MinC [Hydrogenophaga sp.]
MPVSLGGQAPASFDLKSVHLPLLALLLKSGDLDLLRREFGQRYGDQPDFFDHDPLLIDLQGLSGDEALPDLLQVSELLRAHRLHPVAVNVAGEAQRAAAQAAGLPLADAPLLTRQGKAAEPAASAAPAPAPPPVPAPGALVIDKPLRSGQQVYARGGDLVVMAMVNPGAEVIADGHIHVYAPLRGKAMAGARGNAQARIFSLAMAPELISIAGVYRTSEVPLPESLLGKPAQVRLHSNAEGDRLVIDALPT